VCRCCLPPPPPRHYPVRPSVRQLAAPVTRMQGSRRSFFASVRVVVVVVAAVHVIVPPPLAVQRFRDAMVLPLRHTRRLGTWRVILSQAHKNLFHYLRPHDFFRALHTSVIGLHKDRRRRPGRPRHTWLRTLEADLQPLNHGLNSAWRHAQDRGRWRQLVETATFQSGACL